MSPVVWQDGSDLPDRTGRKESLRPRLFRARWTVLRLLQQPLQQQLGLISIVYRSSGYRW